MLEESTMPDRDKKAEFDTDIDPYDFLGFVRNLDGSVTRSDGPPKTSPSSNVYIPSNPFLLIKDIPVNKSNNVCIRLLLPREAVESSPLTKLPLVIFFHGGGFVQFSATSDVFDNFYAKVVRGLVPLIMVSVEYRLAPEHRLPAAYDDGLEVLQWIKNSQDEWLEKYADFSRCFLMGTSAGANIAYHVGLRAAAICVDDLKPLEIKGLVLVQPFFGGMKRTQSELRLALDHEMLVPVCISDVLWELALPLGADRDHEFCNPILGSKIIPEIFDMIKALGWKVLVTGCYGDRLIDRQIEFVKMLEENGVEVVGKFDEGGHHGIDKSQTMIKEFCVVLEEFIKPWFTT